MSDIKLTQKDKVPIKKVVYPQLMRYKAENKIYQDWRADSIHNEDNGIQHVPDWS